MAYHIATHNLATTRDFASCEAYFNNTATIRGFTKEVHGVPLRRDRKNHYTSALHRLKNGEAYACRLYRSDVVTFHRDGRIVVDLTYHSMSTAVFASSFMPYSVTVQSQVLLADREGVYSGAYSPLELVPSQGVYAVNRDTVPTMGVRRVDRKKTKVPRDLIQPLVDYANTLIACTPEGLTQEAAMAMRVTPTPYNPHIHQASLEDLTSPEMWPALVSRHMRTRFLYSSGDTRSFIDPSFFQRLRDRAYELSGAYYMEPLPVGTVHPKMEKI